MSGRLSLRMNNRWKVLQSQKILMTNSISSIMIIPDNHNLIKNGDSVKPFLLDKKFQLVERFPYNGAVYCIYRPSKKI